MLSGMHVGKYTGKYVISRSQTTYASALPHATKFFSKVIKPIYSFDSSE